MFWKFPVLIFVNGESLPTVYMKVPWEYILLLYKASCFPAQTLKTPPVVSLLPRENIHLHLPGTSYSMKQSTATPGAKKSTLTIWEMFHLKKNSYGTSLIHQSFSVSNSFVKTFRIGGDASQVLPLTKPKPKPSANWELPALKQHLKNLKGHPKRSLLRMVTCLRKRFHTPVLYHWK